MTSSVLYSGLLTLLTIASTSELQKTNDTFPRSKPEHEFLVKQFNPENVDYGKWVELQRQNLIESCLKNPYFLYSAGTTITLILAATVCLKQRTDHRRAMWVTAELMADLYNQDAYSRQIAKEAIERYNNHIERCNRVIEGGDRSAAANNQIEQLRTELMRTAEERDMAIRDRDVAREELRRKSEILADMSIRLDATTNKSTSPASARPASDFRGADARLVGHINSLQEQLYAERSSNRRLKGG